MSHLLPNGHLGDARSVAQIDEGDASMITTAINPARQRDGTANVFLAQGACHTGTKHVVLFQLFGTRETSGRYTPARQAGSTNSTLRPNSGNITPQQSCHFLHLPLTMQV